MFVYCSLFMQQKLRIREGVQKDKGSAMNATEITRVVQQGLEETGTRGECATREMAWRRPAGVKGSNKGALPGISSLYHFSYVFKEDDTFEGMRVWAHEGIGTVKWFGAAECSEMWEDDGLLTKDLTGELQESSSNLDPGHVARVRAEGKGAHLIYSDEHRAENEVSAAAKREVKLAGNMSKEEQVRLAREEGLAEAKVHVTLMRALCADVLQEVRLHQARCAVPGVTRTASCAQGQNTTPVCFRNGQGCRALSCKHGDRRGCRITWNSQQGVGVSACVGVFETG